MHIYLVGFMGAGKTCVGRCVAGLLGLPFIDLDHEIEEREGTSIREIFSRCGEARFRLLENEELKRVSAGASHVIALGGGTFCRPENCAIIEATGKSVWLDAPLDVIVARCDDGNASRPLFTTRTEMESLLEARRPFYDKSDIRIDVAGLTIEGAAKQIVQVLAEGQRAKGK
jgi:shikimate kinase